LFLLLGSLSRYSGKAFKLRDVLEQVRLVILGWVNCFRVGNARRAFGWIRFETMRKIRRFAMKQKGRRAQDTDLIYCERELQAKLIEESS
jgi:hypothetical protein